MRALIPVFVVLAATGCSRGPGTDALKGGVGERIAQALPPATVTLTSFARRGSQSDTKAPAGETRRIIYFDADLKLERDFDFGAWDA
ncbi:MAG TPA: glutamate permease, partial [Burkholderiales bacterium]|nr:glutamate permease [Burkholderiales bacterium]